MPPNANQSLCDNPFRACLGWINPGSSSPTTPPKSPTQGHTLNENIHQEPGHVVPMINLPVAHSVTNIQPVSKSTSIKSDAWQAFGMALKALETGAEIFPPLKNAISALLIAEQNRHEYDRMALDLTGLVQTLRGHLPESKPRRMPYSIENVARTIDEQVIYIKKQQNRSGIDQVIRAVDDEMEIIGCYRRIEHIFRQLQTDISLSVWDLAHDQWVDTRLKDLNPVHDARHNAGLSTEMQRRGCTPNTRVKILKGAMDWTQNPSAAKIYWMSGMAGTGKTTIAYTLCERLEEFKQLGACFFCSRASPDCRNVNRIVSTMAYQLARFSNPYQKELCEVLSNNPDVAKRELSVQFQKLIVDPLLKVKDAIPTDVVLVIDALDECSDVRGTQLVLELLFKHVMSLPVKFFITSRPEPTISGKINSSEAAYRFVLHLHDVEESLVQEDIHTYLEDELKAIEAKPADIDRLTVRAGCLFIFAATVVRYIEPYDTSVDHRKRLITILGAHTKTTRQAYRELDELYLAILTRALKEVRGDEGEERRTALQVVLSARESSTISTIVELTGLESEEKVQLTLQPFRSVLRVSLDNNQVIRTLHASFSDFMFDSARSGDFYCDMSEQNAYMATRCLEIMKRSLKFNICNLETSSRLDQDIPDLEIRINQAISSGLSYASRFWGDHLYGAKFSDALANMLDRFLRYRLLYWMEVLNLKDWIGFGTAILLQALNFLPPDDSQADLRTMIQDSRNFITAYAGGPASQSTAHIYISGLPLTSAQSRIREIYWPRMKGMFQITGTAIKDRGDTALATWATGSSIAALALSMDGKRIVSGSFQGAITVWDSSKGTRLLGPLSKHQDVVWCVALSPDDSRIASGSGDCTICISNAYSGATLVGPLTDHDALITSVSFSPDGAFLASSSEDHTIRIWNSFTGAQVVTELRGHQAAVMCAIFSSHGDYLVSCSDDYTIRVWDWRKGATIRGPFEGHTDWVNCVALSPGDTHIASGSSDCTIRVWSIDQGEIIVEPLVGHNARVEFVAFSSDGKRIVSGSYDQTIRVWSSETGQLTAGPFWGHEGLVYSALFSRDDTQIISGSLDGSICIWDANHSITATNTVSVGHTSRILAITLSSDGGRTISGSSDYTICVWDTHDGTLIIGPLAGHTNEVTSLACTYDGTLIISGSLDSTVRTWDAITGSVLANPFIRHAVGVMVVAVSPDGGLIASGAKDGAIKIRNLHSGIEVGDSPAYHSDCVQSVGFSPNGLYLASGSDDMSACLWDANTGSLIWKFEKHTARVMSVAFSPDSKSIVTCSEDRTILKWDASTGTVLSGPWEADGGLFWAAFSSDGARVISVANNGTICQRDAEKGTVLVTSLMRHIGQVHSVTLTPDDRRIVSGSSDHTIRFWDLNPPDNVQHQDLENWVAHDDGWIRDSASRLVLWLPPDLKRILPFPSCSLIIRPEGSVHVNFSAFTYGTRWGDCYSVPSGSDTTAT